MHSDLGPLGKPPQVAAPFTLVASNPMKPSMHLRIALVVLAAIAAGCTNADSSDSSTTSPPTTSLQATTTMDAPPSSITTSAPTSAPVTTVLPITETVASGVGVGFGTSEECPGLTPASTTGSITWADGERLWEADETGAAACLFHTRGTIESVEWGPQGDRLLINDRLIVGGPANGQVIPANVDWQFTFPSGLNLIGIESDGALTKWRTDGQNELLLSVLTRHEAVAYHPSGLHIAVGGDQLPSEPGFDATEGVFIAGNDGSAAVNLVSGSEVEIVDVAFSNDASTLYFIAAHDGVLHMHTVATVPLETESGARQLGTGSEDSATTLAASANGGFESIRVHPSNAFLALWTGDLCAPHGSGGFQVFSGDDAPVVQAFGPTSALGLIGDDPTVVSVATISGPCKGPHDVTLMSANVETRESMALPLSGAAVAAAVRAKAAPHQHDLVDVEIAAFA